MERDGVDDVKTPLLQSAEENVVVRTVTFQISDIKCASCVNSIESALANLNGVKSIAVSSLDGRAAIKFLPKLITTEIDTQLIQKNDIIKIVPGAKVPIDGIVIKGKSYANENMITGEARPIAKSPGDKAQITICVGKTLKWWKKVLKTSMIENHSVQERVHSYVKVGDALIVMDLYSPGCIYCKTFTQRSENFCIAFHIYNLPVLEELLKNSFSCALYIFPTKELAQDQLRSLLHMTKEFDADLNIGIYDGDTSHSERTWLRDNSRLLITNPDMLHISILPHHRLFGRILSNLRFLVIDETHTYKGAFGCHTALILRRLRRLYSHVYGAIPYFIFSTATSANPHEHSMLERGLCESASLNALRSAIDPSLHGTYAHESLKTAVLITINCLNKVPGNRPSIEDVLWNLQYSLQVQEGRSSKAST